MKRRIVKNVFLASSLALTLFAGSLAFTTPAKAAGGATPVLKIKKVLNLPESGVKTPAETFTFTFTKHSKNGKTDETSKNSIPTITNPSVTYANTDQTDADTATAGKQVVKLTNDVLNGVTFTEAGQFTYKVTEASNNTTDMTYSQASYLVSIFTKTTAQNTIVVDSIQIKKEKEDNGNAIADAQKTSYTPGTGDSGTGNNFLFNNNYDKKGGNNNSNGGNITNEDKKGFVLQKKIMGDAPNIDEIFTFTMRVNKPQGSHSAETHFKYYVVNKDGQKQADSEGTYEQDFTVDLKHNERVVFHSVLLGSKVSAKETRDGGYQQNVNAASKLNGQAISTVENLKNGSSIGEDGDNMIIFENTPQTPTGIFLNNLPFIVLALMAGIGIFFFVKNRREEEELEI